MYAFESSGSRKGLHVMVVVALVVAFGLFTVSSAPAAPMPMLFQVGAVICLAVAVYLTTRYSLRLYRYAVEPSGIVSTDGVEQHDLIITEITGKKQRVVTRIGLRDMDRSSVVAVHRSDKEAYAAIREAYRAPWQIFRYANTPVIAHICVIPVPGEQAVLFIPMDEGMLAILRG